MKIANQLLRLNRHLNRISQEAPVSNARLETLRLIKENNPITLKQLCEIQRVSMPTMSKLVDELQDDSLVFRAQSKDDARQRWIVPTQKGLLQCEKAVKQRQKFWQMQLKEIDQSESKKIEVVLDDLLQRLEGNQS